MKVQVVLDKLNRAISMVEKLAERNASLPILECVLVKAEKNELVIRATNLHTGIEVKIPAKIEEEGEIAVRGGLMSRFLQSLAREKNTVLETEEGYLKIVTNSSSTKLKIQDANDFPIIPQTKSTNCFVLNSVKFIEGLRAVAYSAANTEIKPEIASVYVYPKEENLVFVATDSFRLAEKQIKVDRIENFPSTIIPIKNAREIIRIFSDNTGDLEICVDNTQISFSTDGIYLISRTVEGSFPDYAQIIPRDFSTEAVFLKKDISDAFRVIEPFSDDYNQITMSIDTDKEECLISAKNTKTGESSIRVDGKFTGDSAELRFNYSYFTESLSSIGGDSLIFRTKPGKPILVESIHDTTFICLIMPITR